MYIFSDGLSGISRGSYQILACLVVPKPVYRIMGKQSLKSLLLDLLKLYIEL